MVVKKIGVLSLAKLMGIVYGAFGLVGGAILSVFALLGAAFGGGDFADAGLGLLFGGAAVFVLPLFYGIMGFIGGALTGFVLNLAMRFAGGLELEVE